MNAGNFSRKKYFILPLILIFTATLFFPLSIKAAGPFGGKINKIQICVKPPGLLLHIGPPVGGKYLLTSGSKIYMYAAIRPSNWTLGLSRLQARSCRGLPNSIGGMSLTSAVSGVMNLGKLQSLGSVGLQSLTPNLAISAALGPVGLVTTALSVANAYLFTSSVAGFAGINLPGLKNKKLKELGPAYPIIMTGTSAAP